MAEESPELAGLLEEQHAPWEAVEEGVLPPLSVEELFEQRPDAVLQTIASQGVSKLGEFRAQESLVFPAFSGDVLCTLGADAQVIDFERAWRKQLKKLVPSHKKPTGWSQSVVLEAFVINIKGAARPDKAGLLQPLLRRWQAGGVSLSVWGLPAVQAVVDFKWDTFAKRLMLWELCIFAVWLLSFATWTVLFQDEDLDLSLSELARTGHGAATLVAEAVALVAMVPFLVLEWGTLQAYGIQGWFNIWNAQDLATYVIQVTITVCHLARAVQGGWVSVLAAVQVILLLFRLQWFSRCFTSTRWSFIETVREAMSSISAFLGFVLLVMLGFGVAFHVLFRLDQDTTEGFDTILDAFLTMFASQGQLLDLNMTRKTHNPVAASVFAVVYYFIMGMVLMNLLIGIMSNALARSGEHEALKLMLSKVQVIDELESTIPGWIEEKFGAAWFPNYVHILRVDPDRVGKVDLDFLWTKPAEVASAGGGGGDSARLDALARSVEEQGRQLARVEALLQTLAGGAAAKPAATPASSVA